MPRVRRRRRHALSQGQRRIISGGVPHRKAGLVIRKDLEPGSIYVDAVVHGSGLTALQWREKPDDVTRTVHFPVEMGNTEVAPNQEPSSFVFIRVHSWLIIVLRLITSACAPHSCSTEAPSRVH